MHPFTSCLHLAYTYVTHVTYPHTHHAVNILIILFASGKHQVPSGHASLCGVQNQWLRQQPGRRASVYVAASASSAAAAAGLPGDQPGASGTGKRVAAFLAAFWKFLRPHTIRGTILGTSAVVTKALLQNPQAIDWGLLPRALLGLLALICGNGYIVGINQIYDVDIDAVNKPFLPIAAGKGIKEACSSLWQCEV